MVYKDKLTVDQSMADFRDAWASKRKLVEREKEDFLFALGKQWNDDDVQKLSESGVKAVTDNRIQPNIFLITGLERQNRAEFKAFPEGEEDSLKAEIASALFKNAIKTSDFLYKSSEQFKDGITCGESHIELYLDKNENILNGKPCWKKIDGNCLFPEPGYREYDFSDARYVYKITLDIPGEDLINLFPSKKKKIQEANGGRLNFADFGQDGETHHQPKDYKTNGGDTGRERRGNEEKGFDLIERYYKKWVEKVFVGDKKTGEIREAESKDKATAFIDGYKEELFREQQSYEEALAQHQAIMAMGQEGQMVQPTGPAVGFPNGSHPPPVPPAPKDPERFILILKMVPEIWCFAHTPGIEEELADEQAWFYPKWKKYPFVPYFARFSTAPLTGDDRHLLIQGIVHGVKNAQERHNKAATLLLRHLNTTANSGWLSEEDTWVDPDKVRQFGSTPGVSLEYKTGKPKPDRIFPMALSQGHAQLTAESAEDIKAQLGINADLLAVQEGGSSSGRAIALRQRQGLVMVQELFDNLARTRGIAGKFLLTQLGEMYDTETAQKVLGEAFLRKNFPPLMLKQFDEATGQVMEVPQNDAAGTPMEFDKEMAETVIAEVLSGDLGTYDVSVGESVASETMRIANAAELKEIASSYPGLIPPDILIEESQLPQSTKNKVLSVIKNAQAAAVVGPPRPAATPGGNNEE